MPRLESFIDYIKENKHQLSLQPKKKNLKIFWLLLLINKFFKNKKIHTPRLIKQNFKEGIIEIEDFGKNTLLHYLKNKK